MSLNPISSQSLTVFIYLFIVVIVSRTRSRALVAGDGIPATGRASSSEADIFVERIQSTKHEGAIMHRWAVPVGEWRNYAPSCDTTWVDGGVPGCAS